MTHSDQTSDRTISELGENGILQVILPILSSSSPNLGPGDDAGALAVNTGEVLVSVDTIVENQDFRLRWPSGWQHHAFDIGWKSMAQNLSDINAMGGRTTGVVISLSLPGNTTESWIKGFADGVAQALKSLSSSVPPILGGDLSLSTEISVTTTVLGEVKEHKVLRSGAQAEQVVAVAGRVGMSAAGLALLEHPESQQHWGRSMRRLIASQCRPVPPLESGPRAAQAGASAMLDLSDGLIIDAGRLAVASGVAIEIDSAVLGEFTERLEPAAELLGIEPLQWVLYGGEDFGILATFPDEAAVPEEFVIIGKTIAMRNGCPAVYIDGEKMAESQGFDHFASVNR
ncbi:thiamine-phosphate kinase [Glutamicibacter uratoxydans]|uniref:thiamine-phosphate kinase n=1 Tax=Glutamicibacter uratoxydans TaxID=43667 RepID=UPI003D6E61C7